VTSYSVHHFPDPGRHIAEMARVVRPGGRVGILDIFLPQDPAISALNTRIEKLRDASHTRTLSHEEIEKHFAAHGLRVLETGVERNSRSFDHWMLVAGLQPGDPNYVEARRLMEGSIPDDAAWFHPRFEPGESGPSELVLTNTTFFIAGEKL
jgi:SAM-dependent methyltransferase